MRRLVVRNLLALGEAFTGERELSQERRNASRCHIVTPAWTWIFLKDDKLFFFVPCTCICNNNLDCCCDFHKKFYILPRKPTKAVYCCVLKRQVYSFEIGLPAIHEWHQQARGSSISLFIG